MKGRAYIKIVCANQSDANAVRDDLTTWLQARADRWLVEGRDPVALLVRGIWMVFADCAFTARLGADELLARVQARWTSGPIAARILVGSTVRLHNCNHDTGIGFCTFDTTITK